jgi:hypothetical protein
VRLQIKRDARGRAEVEFDTAPRHVRYTLAVDMPLYRAVVRRVFTRVMAENAALRRRMPVEHTFRGLLARAIARRLAR